MGSKRDGSASPNQATIEVKNIRRMLALEYIPLREVKSRFRGINEVTASTES